MLFPDFYRFDSITSREVGNQTIVEGIIRINKTHSLLEGHFPGFPVVPGVCMIHMIKSMTENHFGVKLQLQHSSNIKFLSVLNPTAVNIVSAEIQCESSAPDVIEVEARLYSPGLVFFKMKAAFLIKRPN